jgi:myo-inositol-1(or 4)-monophosphatase
MNATTETSDDFLQLVETTARNAAKTAGAIAMRYLNASSPQEKGSSNNMVTRADIEAQQAIADTIRGAFPAHSFLGEEGDKAASAGPAGQGASNAPAAPAASDASAADAASNAAPAAEAADAEVALQAEHLWVVDPVDGTNNYAQGLPFFCVSIAYLSYGVPLFGLVYDPSRDELFCARRGGGAFLNDKAIQVSGANEIEGAIVSTGFAYERGEYVRRTLRTVQALFDDKLRGIRRFGACALDLCWTAAGRLDGFFELKLEPWDYAAGMLIVTEAGGRVSDAEGGPLSIGAPAVVASAPGMHDAFLKIIGEAR